ncbi:hypothetical protein [Janthinobacterium lividum]|uniref:hypothetical protein n=1 Tax=Janthinobacterium lividum TaxID=29581 RepID=UPI00140B9462|nr:hypothetical protein [Janthinobacterium lividum]
MRAENTRAELLVLLNIQQEALMAIFVVAGDIDQRMIGQCKALTTLVMEVQGDAPVWRLYASRQALPTQQPEQTMEHDESRSEACAAFLLMY